MYVIVLSLVQSKSDDVTISRCFEKLFWQGKFNGFTLPLFFAFFQNKPMASVSNAQMHAKERNAATHPTPSIADKPFNVTQKFFVFTFVTKTAKKAKYRRYFQFDVRMTPYNRL